MFPFISFCHFLLRRFILHSRFLSHPFFETPPGTIMTADDDDDDDTKAVKTRERPWLLCQTIRVSRWDLLPKSSPPYPSAGGRPRSLRPTGTCPRCCVLLQFVPSASWDSCRLRSLQLRCSDEVNIQMWIAASWLKQTYTNPTDMTDCNRAHWTFSFLLSFCSLYLWETKAHPQHFLDLFVAVSCRNLFVSHRRLHQHSALPSAMFKIQPSRLIYGISFFPACSVRSPRVLWYMSSN